MCIIEKRSLFVCIEDCKHESLKIELSIKYRDTENVRGRNFYSFRLVCQITSYCQITITHAPTEWGFMYIK